MIIANNLDLRSFSREGLLFEVGSTYKIISGEFKGCLVIYTGYQDGVLYFRLITDLERKAICFGDDLRLSEYLTHYHN